MRASRGFTLVEVLAVTAIMTFIFSTLFLLIIHGLRDWNTVSEKTELRNGANTVISAIQRDLLKARQSGDGQDAVYVSSDQKVLRIVTEWEAGGGGQPSTPKNVIVYTIRKDTGTGAAQVYRYVGPPPASGQLGMQLLIPDLDYDHSGFDPPSEGRVTVSLTLLGRGSDFHTSSSLRFLYGS